MSGGPEIPVFEGFISARPGHQKNLITQALGTSARVKADLFQETVSPGDAILLCSVGLVNQVTDQEICQGDQAGERPKKYASGW